MEALKFSFLQLTALILPCFDYFFCFWEASKWSHIHVNNLKWKFVIPLNILDHLKWIKKASRSVKVQFSAIYSLNMGLFWVIFCFWKPKNDQKNFINGLKWNFAISLSVFYQNSYLKWMKKPLEASKYSFFNLWN